MNTMTEHMPTYLPPEALLADYACGAVSPGVSLLVSAHLAKAQQSAATVARFEAIAGALMVEDQAAEIAPSSLDAVLGRLDAEDDQSPRSLEAGPLPQPLIDAVGTDFNKIPWRFALPGLSEHILKDFSGEDEEVSLLRGRPGVRIPQHTHEGEEMTLVLTGALQDGGRIFRAGDIALNDENDDHKPRIVGTEICHCLVVNTGRLRFTGPLSRALNLLGE